MLAYKAENAGRQLLEIDPQYTSQECPNCHAIAKKALSKRVHRCDCGLTLGRDHAAALVILGVDYAFKRRQRGGSPLLLEPVREGRMSPKDLRAPLFCPADVTVLKFRLVLHDRKNPLREDLG
jgi:hypothetical protein